VTKKRSKHTLYLFKILECNPCENIVEEENRLLSDANTPAWMLLQNLSPLKKCELQSENWIHDAGSKTPGYDVITNQVLQKLPQKGIKFISHLCNVVFRRSFFSSQWKIAQIIIMEETDKSVELVETYKPISWLPVEIIRETFTYKTLCNNGEI